MEGSLGKLLNSLTIWAGGGLGLVHFEYWRKYDLALWLQTRNVLVVYYIGKNLPFAQWGPGGGLLEEFMTGTV